MNRTLIIFSSIYISLFISQTFEFSLNIEGFNDSYSFVESLSKSVTDMRQNDKIILRNQSQQENLQSNGKRENIYRYKYKNGKKKGKGILMESKFYTTKGYIIFKDNSKTYYNTNNQKTKEIIQRSSNNCDTVYYYYKDSLFIKSRRITNSYTTEIINEYDSFNCLINNCKKMNGSVISSFQYTYNDNHQMIKSIFNYSNSSTPSITEYFYSDSTITEINKDKDSINYKFYFKLDSLGNWMEQSFTNKEGIKTTTYYDYDSQNRRISEKNDHYYKEWKYDKNSLLIYENENWNSGNSTEINYFYDSNNRLIKKIFIDKKSENNSWVELITYE